MKKNRGNTLPIVIVIVVITTIMIAATAMTLYVRTKQSVNQSSYDVCKFDLENEVYGIINVILENSSFDYLSEYETNQIEKFGTKSSVDSNKLTISIHSLTTFETLALNCVIVFEEEASVYKDYKIESWGFTTWKN